MTDEAREYIKKLRAQAEAERLSVMREKTAELLAVLSENLRPSSILEVGACIGCSGIAVLSSCEGKLTTIEKDAALARRARENFASCGFAARAEVIEGDCYEVVSLIRDSRFDLIVLDGPKGHYDELFLLLYDMLNEGGALFADDVGYHGKTAEVVTAHKHRTIVRAMRKFISAAEESGNAEFYDIEDGVAIVRKERA